ncbi:MAG: hypothetical protein U0T82_17435 [Bacteroidales bacterium]
MLRYALSEGKIVFDRWWFTLVPIHLIDAAGTSHDIPVEMHGNGYNYEAEEVGRCLREGKKQSDLWSWNDSLDLIGLMDSIRMDCGIFYRARLTTGIIRLSRMSADILIFFNAIKLVARFFLINFLAFTSSPDNWHRTKLFG